MSRYAVQIAKCKHGLSRKNCGPCATQAWGDEQFFLGVCVSLSVIYSIDRDPTAVLPVELLDCVGQWNQLLKFAKKNEEPDLASIRRTVAECKRRRKQ